MSGSTMKGLKFKFLGKNIRVWKNGMEIGNNLGGRVYFFPWFKHSKDRIDFVSVGVDELGVYARRKDGTKYRRGN